MGRKKRDIALQLPVKAADNYECSECGKKFRDMADGRCPHWVDCQKGIIMHTKCKMLFEVNAKWADNSKRHLGLGCDEVFVLTHPHTVTLTLFCQNTHILTSGTVEWPKPAAQTHYKSSPTHDCK